MAMPSYAGLRSWRKTRTTGTYVGVYNGEEAGLDTSGGTQPWSTICEAHHEVCSHETRRLAEEWAPHPEQWCSQCRTAYQESR